MIDSTTIRAHRHAAGAKGKRQSKEGLGRSCGGFSSKIDVKVNGLGIPLVFIITSGQLSDIGQAEELVQKDSASFLLADRGYDSDSFRQILHSKNICPVIPVRKNRLKPV